jgi:hypothetical protein
MGSLHNRFTAAMLGGAALFSGGLAARIAAANATTKPIASSFVARDTSPSLLPVGNENIFVFGSELESANRSVSSAVKSSTTANIGSVLTKNEMRLTINKCHSFVAVGSTTMKAKNDIVRLFVDQKINTSNGTAESTYYVRRRQNKHFKLCGAGVVATLFNNQRRKLKLEHRTDNGGDVTDQIVYGPNGFRGLAVFVTETHPK